MFTFNRAALSALLSALLITPATAEEQDARKLRKAVESAPKAYMLGNYLAGQATIVGPSEISLWVSSGKSSAFRNAVNREIVQAACNAKPLRDMLKLGAVVRFDVRFREETLPFALNESGCLPSGSVALKEVVGTPAEVLASVFRPNLPIELRDGAGIFDVAAEGRNLRFVLQKADGRSAANEVGFAADQLCEAQGSAKFFATGGVFIIEVTMRSGSAKRYSVDSSTCASGGDFKVREVPLPLPALVSPAIIEFGQPRPSVTFSSCTEWKAQLDRNQTNEDWLRSFSLEPIEKGEFESTSEFNQRKASRNPAFANVSFKIDPSELSYDVDRQLLSVGPLINRKTLVSEELGRDTYVGTNAFGVSVNVLRIRSYELNVEFENATAVLPSRLTIPMVPQAAQAIERDGSLHVLGQIVKTASGGGRGAPTINSPLETFRSETTVTINPICVATMVGGTEISWDEPRL